MTKEELTFERGGKKDPREAVKSFVEAQLAQAIDVKEEKLKAEAGKLKAELTIVPKLGQPEWEVFAWGPYKNPHEPYLKPGRIIYVGETAYIATAIWMDEDMQKIVNGGEFKFQLNYWTSNTQTMQPIDDLHHSCCIYAAQGGPAYYVTVWELTPTQAACLLETNICVRICNCNDHFLPEYAGFVRHVFDFDPEKLWPAIPGFPPLPVVSPTPGWGFDRPIRYMVADEDGDCMCDEECGPVPEDHPDLN